MFSVEAPVAAAGDAYVVALIDGGIIRFHDDLIKANGDGGARAAKFLGQAIQQHLEKTKVVATKTHTHLRVFADLRDMSLHAVRDKLVPSSNQVRVLDPFAASFSRVQPLYDFVDVSDKSYIATKVRSNFEGYAEDPRCKRIYFAVSLSTRYLNMLKAYSALEDKVVLVFSGDVSADFRSLGFKELEVPKVFHAIGYPERHVIGEEKGQLHVRPKFTALICPDFERQGFCTQKSCQFIHVLTGEKAPGTNVRSPESPGSTSYSDKHGEAIGVNAVRQASPVSGQTVVRRGPMGRFCFDFTQGRCRRTKCKFDHSIASGTAGTEMNERSSGSFVGSTVTDMSKIKKEETADLIDL